MTDVLPPSASDISSSPSSESVAAPADAGGRLPADGRRRRLLVAAGVLAAVALGLVVATLLASRFRPHLYAGTVLQGEEPAPSLAELIDGDGVPIDLAAHEGEVVLVFFGYTNCPDVCPTTLADAAGAIDQLDPDDAERTNLVMVSVDPFRDDPATVDSYAGFFHPDFRGASGPTEAIDRAASAYGVFYRLGAAEPDGGYWVDHTGSLIGIGPDGSIRVIWASGVGSDALAGDIQALLS